MQIYCGLKQQPPRYRFETADYDLFQVIVVFSGTLFMTVQNVVTALCSGSVVYLPVGCAFRLHTEEMGYQGVFVTISSDGDDLPHGTALALAITPEARAVAELIEAEARHPDEQSDNIHVHLGLLLANLGMRLARQQQQQGTPIATNEYWVRFACQSIEKAVYTSQPLEVSLANIPLSYRQLSRLFHTVMAMTPKQYQMHCRLREAERLLTTRLPITSIAHELGFASSQHFSSQFARFKGVPPSVFREQTRSTQ